MDQLALTPHGRLALVDDPDAPPLEPELAQRLRSAFERGSGHGLLQLGAAEAGAALPPVFSYWREFGAGYVTALCTQPDAHVPAPSAAELERLVLSVPPMTGAEYLTAEILNALWQELDAAFGIELAESKCGIQDFLKRRNPAWNLVGRVHFNLAENRKDLDAPFAFLATYTTRLTANAKAQHLPLGKALGEYAGAANKDRLLSLLLPVQRASETCPRLKALVDGGEIFHPLRWTPNEAIQLLRDVPQLESAGVVVRMPAAWRANRPPRPQVSAQIGGKPPMGLGQDALLDFQMEVTLDGERLTAAEIRELLEKSDGLALVRGRWVEVDGERLRRMLEHFREVERTAAENGLGFREAARLLAGADVEAGDASEDERAEWSQVVAGPWLAETLKGLRSPEGLARIDPGAALHATLRPSQQVGVRWLYLIAKLGLGACLADDMGLGKTMQVLSLLLVLKRQTAGHRQPSLLVAPASLLANWASEMERFAPGLKAFVAHPSALPAAELKTVAPERLRGVDLVITSYGSLLRVPWIAETGWQLVVLDEAQAIKRELVRPYILRRLKTDQAVIADLPDKTEVKAFCQLSRKQAALYEQSVKELATQLEEAEGIQRKGLVLSFLMRLKQICNHPSQWLGDGSWAEDDSGKWARLRDIAEVIAARQEKMLVFTQFREVIAPLAAFLGSVFGRPGLVLHGETPVKQRQETVRRFQEDEAVGFFVLSLKAGGHSGSHRVPCPSRELTVSGGARPGGRARTRVSAPLRAHTCRTGAGYWATSGSVVSRVMPSTIDCATRRRSKGSLWMGGRPSVATACSLVTGDSP
jgi:hypothetical protein